MLHQKENRGAITRLKITRATYLRETLCDLPVNTRSKSASSYYSTLATKVASPQTKCLRRIPSSNVVMKRTLTTGEVLLDAKEYFELLDDLSPIRPPSRPVQTSTCFVPSNRVVQKPAVKRTLLHRSIPKKSISTHDVYIRDAFYSPYLMETVKCFLSSEFKYVLRPSFVKLDSVSVKNRTIVLNWLQQLHQNAAMGPTVFLTAVRLYDYLLTTRKVAAHLYHLMAIATIWLVNKVDTCSNFGAAKILKCSGSDSTYSPDELINMEIQLLKIFKFNLLLPDPVTFVCYYLRLLRMQENFKVFTACASFVLESFALNPEFSTFSASFQAAAATHLVITTLDPNFRDWDVLRSYPGYYTTQEMHSLQVHMVKAVREQQNPACKCRETYSKYSTPEFGSVSVIYGDHFTDC